LTTLTPQGAGNAPIQGSLGLRGNRRAKMTILNEEIEFFFQQNIFDMDEDEVNSFLEKYDREEILRCLFEKLKVIATSDDTDEPAWRLGRIFGDISKRYNADTVVYSWLNIFDMKEKRSLLNFLSGYWDQSRADLNVLIGLAAILKDVISNELRWPNEVAIAGIEGASQSCKNILISQE
jgi:hypothetical protein